MLQAAEEIQTDLCDESDLLSPDASNPAMFCTCLILISIQIRQQLEQPGNTDLFVIMIVKIL